MAAALLPGTLLDAGRFQLEHELNRGGTATVWRAFDRSTGQQVALKVMAILDSNSAALLQNARREVATASELRHKSIVQLLHCFWEATPQGQLLVLVWELVQGADLLDTLNAHGGILNERTAADYFRQLAEALQFIHANGLCHRDIKPENCMITPSGQLKLIDFGLSKHAESAVTLGVGTPDYLAPELLNGGDLRTLRERQTGSYDASKVDVWSMGVLLYLIVTGQYPFEDPAQPQNVVITLQNIAAIRHRPVPPHVSPACADLLGRILVMDPQARISVAGILQHPWVVGAGTAEAAQLAAAAAQQRLLADAVEAAVQPAAAGAAAPAQAAPTFSFHHHLAGVDAKATPATPRVIHLHAAAATAGTAAPPSSPVYYAPASRTVPTSAQVSAPITPVVSRNAGSSGNPPAVATAGANEAGSEACHPTKRQRAAGGGFFCSFFGLRSSGACQD